MASGVHEWPGFMTTVRGVLVLVPRTRKPAVRDKDSITITTNENEGVGCRVLDRRHGQERLVAA